MDIAGLTGLCRSAFAATSDQQEYERLGELLEALDVFKARIETRRAELNGRNQNDRPADIEESRCAGLKPVRPL